MNFKIFIVYQITIFAIYCTRFASGHDSHTSLCSKNGYWGPNPAVFRCIGMMLHYIITRY